MSLAMYTSTAREAQTIQAPLHVHKKQIGSEHLQDIQADSSGSTQPNPFLTSPSRLLFLLLLYFSTV